MNDNSEILEILIEEDFGLKGNNSSRYGKGVEHDSLVIDKEKGIFFWNSQGIVGDPFVYLTKVRNYSFQQAREYLNKFQYVGTHVYTINTGKDDIIVYPKLVDVFHDLGKDSEKRKYLYDRGITDNTIDLFQIGWYNGYITIPFFDEGTFRNFQMRMDNPKKIRSYYKGLGPLMFNSSILKLTNEIYITEGPVDALALIQNGLPAISTNSGGLVISEWFWKFSRQKQIYLLFDADDAGLKDARNVSNILGVNRCKIYCFWGEDKGYDPVDFYRDGRTTNELKKLIEKESKYLFEL